MARKTEMREFPIVQIISEHKRVRGDRPERGYRRVLAAVRVGRRIFSRHCDTADGKIARVRWVI